MQNNQLFKFFTLTLLFVSLLACQTTQKTIPDPEPAVEAKVQAAQQTESAQQKQSEADPPQTL